jgi:hypothetical protein
MKRNHDLRRLLRWYPPSWRARYGDEFLALLEDRLNDAPLSIRLRSSVAIAGIRERCYGSGLVGARSTPSTQRRTGSLMVLVAWSIMIVGGVGLVKMAEHYSSSLPSPSRTLATFFYDATAIAGIVGTLLVLSGAAVALPGFARFVRQYKWLEVRRTFGRPILASAILVGATIGLSAWAHHLNTSQRSGGNNVYAGAFIALALVLVITIGLWTVAGVVTASRIDFTPRVLRWESFLALGVCLSSIVVVVGATAWWIQMDRHAPWFLNGTPFGASTSPWTAQLIVTALLMAIATAAALWGAVRVAMSYRPSRVESP